MAARWAGRSRSAPVPGRSHVHVSDALEKSTPVIVPSLLRPRTGALRPRPTPHLKRIFKQALRRFINSPLVLSAIFLFFTDADFATVQGKETDSSAKALRPFYIIGHQADTLKEAKEYIRQGANGLEVNVNILAGQTNALCIGHGPRMGTGAAGDNSTPLTNFLQGLHELAVAHTNFCLVYFDCKSLAATPELGANLLGDIRTYLVGSGADRVDLNVIISVGTLKDKAIFANIAGQLGPREGLMVDGVSNPVEVSEFFAGAKVLNQAFFDGVVPFNTCLSHFAIGGAVKKACKLRDQDHKIRFVGTWSVNNPWLLTRFIKMGVDGIVVDRTFVWYNFSWANMGNGLRTLKGIVRIEGTKLGIRSPNRDDNPFTIHEEAAKALNDASAPLR